MGYYNLFDYANCKHFRVAQSVIDSRINTKVHCYFEFCKTYLIVFFFDESEVVPIQFRNKADSKLENLGNPVIILAASCWICSILLYVCDCVHDWWLHWMYIEQRFGKNEDVDTIKVPERTCDTEWRLNDSVFTRGPLRAVLYSAVIFLNHNIIILGIWLITSAILPTSVLFWN